MTNSQGIPKTKPKSIKAAPSLAMIFAQRNGIVGYSKAANSACNQQYVP
jgi:hypothetical protein